MDFPNVLPFAECDFLDFGFMLDDDLSAVRLLAHGLQTEDPGEAGTADRPTQQHDLEMQGLHPKDSFQEIAHQPSQNSQGPERRQERGMRMQSSEDWECHKERIQSLYIARGFPLKMIIEIMGREHGFRAR
jgi:hypothetical protein